MIITLGQLESLAKRQGVTIEFDTNSGYVSMWSVTGADGVLTRRPIDASLLLEIMARECESDKAACKCSGQ